MNTTIELLIEGANCASCVSKIETAAFTVNHVQVARMNFVQRILIVEGSPQVTELIDAIQQAGYTAKLLSDQTQSLTQHNQQNQHLFIHKLMKSLSALIVGCFIMFYGMALDSMQVTAANQWVWLLLGLLTLISLVWSGKEFLVLASHGLFKLNFNMNTLIALGTSIAWIYSMWVVLLPETIPISARYVYFEATTMILGFINLGHALEIKLKGRTSQAIQQLMNLAPKTATVIRDNENYIVAVADLNVGDHIRIQPGGHIPVDGQVILGQTLVNEEMLTGESIPKIKNIGDLVSAGTTNTQGTIVIRALQVGRKTVLAKITEMVKIAQHSKPTISQLADKVASIFVPVVLVFACLTFIIWYYFVPSGNITLATIFTITVLIIACPCALGLATPMSIMVGIGQAAQRGMLIKNSQVLQVASQLDIILLDKTGTITSGSPCIQDIQSFSEMEQLELLRLAASIQIGSEHPISKAFIDMAKQRHLSLLTLSNFSAVIGTGVKGVVDGRQVVIGNSAMMRMNQINIQKALPCIELYSQLGQSPIICAVNQKLAAVFAISDTVKPDSKAAIKALHQENIKVIMLTGDHNQAAQLVAQEVGIEHIYSQVSPEQKLQVVKSLQAEGHRVAMAGDGINDSPALAKADIGFALWRGTDIAIESADITLMQNSLFGLLDTIHLSRRTMRNIKQNLWGAFIYNIFALPLAAGLFYPWFGWQLNPMIAGAAMALSSLTVVFNAYRLYWMKFNSRDNQPTINYKTFMNKEPL